MTLDSPQGTAGPRVAVVILTLNQREVTLRCLRSVERLTHPSIEIVVVDNGSSDGTADAVRKQFPRVRLVRLETNRGVAGGRNAGARAALEDGSIGALFFCDNDTELDRGCLEPLVAALEDRSVALAVPKIRYLERPEVLDAAGFGGFRLWDGVRFFPVGQGEVDRGQHDEPRDLPVAPGIVMMRRETFEELGGYDEAYSPFMYEDTDLALRALERGMRIRYAPGGVVFHKGSHTFGGGGYGPEYARVKGRNLMRLMRRHATLRDWMLFGAVAAPRAAALAAARQARLGQLRSVGALLQGAFGRSQTPGGADGRGSAATRGAP